MNRTMQTAETSGLRLPPCAVTVATSWVDPQRGPVFSPAHDLLAAAARRAGFAVRQGPVPAPDAPGGDGVLVTVSYVAPSGQATGLALGAPAGDVAALAFAREQIRSWRGVLRTRRLLVPDALEAQAPPQDGPSRGLLPQQAPQGKPRACGCRLSDRCRAVEDAVEAVRASQARGDRVLLIGLPLTDSGALFPPALSALSALPPAPAPLTPAERARVTHVATLDAARALVIDDPANTAFVVAPGAAIGQVTRILAYLRARAGRLRGQSPSQWCYTMSDLQLATATAVAESDCLLILGAADSPRALLARAAAERSGVDVHTLTSPHAIRPEQVDAATITLVDASPETGTGDTVTGLLGGLGPCAPVFRSVRSRHPASRPPGVAYEPAPPPR